MVWNYTWKLDIICIPWIIDPAISQLTLLD